jgi:predicted porin
MKKTIIASAIAAVVAAPAAFADVKISGQINAEIFDNNGANGYQMDENSDVKISGSEDLGNGMKAFFTLNASPDAGGTAGIGEDDRYVGISGDFGTVTLGRFENLLTSKISTFVDNDAADSLTVELTGFGSSSSRAQEGVRYDSPNMNGFSVSAEGYMNGQGTQATATSNFDTVNVMASYSNAGLTVSVGKSSQEDAAEDLTVIGAKYSMGDLSAAVVMTDSDVAATGKATVGGVTYTMGANQVVVNHVFNDDATSSTDGDTLVTLKHSLSKATNVYVGFKSDDNSEDTTLIGMKHSF